LPISELEMVFRVALAAVLGAAIGSEREMQQKTAGLRTHTLVATGAALFAVAGASFGAEFSAADPTRVAAGIVTGIGFIGAGSMVRSGLTITGLTTAATLWLAGALGVASGFGYYLLAPTALFVALVSMIGFAPVRKYMRRGVVQLLEIEYHAGHGTLTPLFESLNAFGATVDRISMIEDGGTRKLTCGIVGIGSESLDHLVASLRARDEVIKVTPPPK
jgi:putative Mg2+ transporter-C (MgtC) family protein